MRRRTIRTSVPWLCMEIAGDGVGIFTLIILVSVYIQGNIDGVDNLFTAAVRAPSGSGFIDLLLVLGFAIGIALVIGVTRIRMQILGFLCDGRRVWVYCRWLRQRHASIVTARSSSTCMMNAGPISPPIRPVRGVPVAARRRTGLADSGVEVGASAGVLDRQGAPRPDADAGDRGGPRSSASP